MSNTAITSRYKYDDIQSEGRFRLLAILPSSAQNESTAIRCSLELRPLPADIPYEALSYAWGKGPADHGILVNDSTFLVSRTVFCALRELRQVEQKRVVWIDAICINQSDNVEKGHQVSQMRQIYSQAEQVIVWLGEGNDLSDLGMQTLHWIFAGCIALREELNSTFTGIQLFRSVLGAFLEFSDFEQRLVGLETIFCQRWFDRVWVLQEIFLAKKSTVYFGKMRVPWSYLEKFAMAIQDETQTLLSPRRLKSERLSEIVRSLMRVLTGISSIAAIKDQFSNNSVTLEYLLIGTGHFEATCAVDKIYALLGLCLDTYGIYPDYSLTLGECLYTTWKAILTQTGCISVLGFLCTSFKPYTPFSTWIPVMDGCTVPGRTLVSPGMHGITCDFYRAAPKCIPTYIEFQDNDTTLVLRGLVCDSVHNIGDRFPWTTKNFMHNGPISLIPVISQAEEMISEWHGSYINGDTLQSAFWRTMTLDHEREGYYYESESKKRLSKPHAHIPPSTQNDTKLLIASMHYSYLWPPTLSLKKFFTTQGKYMGFCPPHTQKDDIVCVFLGAAVPFVLREVPNGRYEMIGQCYMHGIMDGEAFEQAGENVVYQDFKIQ